MFEENKVALSRKRTELVESLTTPLSNEDRIHVQGELSIVNAKIKALNTTEAARLKAAADRRKVSGLAEAQANAARARAKVNGTRPEDEPEPEEDDDPGQTTAIDGWIDAVLLRHDVDFKRSPNGSLMLAIPQKWHTILDVLIAGIYAAARGQELPELPPIATPKPEPKPKSKKR